MRATVRLDDELSAHVDAIRQESDDSDAEAVRTCIRRSQQLEEFETEYEETIDELEAECDELGAELEEKKVEIGRLEGKLETIHDRLGDKDDQIESLERRIDSLEARNQELTNIASAANKSRETELQRAGGSRSVLGRIRDGIFGGRGDDE